MRQSHAALAALLLAACSKPAPQGKSLSAAEVSKEAGKLRLQPGTWETTTVITDIEVSGLPAGATDAAKGTPTTTRNCITPEQAARPDANVLSGTRDGNCTYQRFSMADSRIDAAMTCSPRGLPGTMAMTLTGGYTPRAFGIGMDMKADLPGNTAMAMKATVRGKRVGECTSNGEAAQ